MKYVCVCAYHSLNMSSQSYSLGTGIQPFLYTFFWCTFTRKRHIILERTFGLGFCCCCCSLYLSWSLVNHKSHCLLSRFHRKYMWKKNTVREFILKWIILLLVLYIVLASRYDYRYCYFISRSFLSASQSLNTERCWATSHSECLH